MKMPELPPWNKPEDWNQIQQFFEVTFNTEADFSSSRCWAEDIALKMSEIDNNLQDLCTKTCTHCHEVCCLKATLWYDFNDLLFCFLRKGKIPERQISRKGDGACCHLDRNGCLLQRIDRPFICTWYICQQQRELSEEKQQQTIVRNLIASLNIIKASRKRMEKCFLETVL